MCSVYHKIEVYFLHDTVSRALRVLAPGNDLQTRINELQKLVQLQVQAMFTQQNKQSLWNCTLATSTTSIDVRQVKVPDRHYNMTLSEYRTYFKDCRDYKH